MSEELADGKKNFRSAYYGSLGVRSEEKSISYPGAEEKSITYLATEEKSISYLEGLSKCN